VPSPSKVMQHPTCPKCGAEMMLARVEPSSPGVDQRTFECKCGHVEMMPVKYE
jgi:ribosomal protein S27AE